MDSKYIINKKDLKSASLYAPSWFIFGAISIYIFLIVLFSLSET